MEKFITRKRKLSIDQSAFAVAESESTGKVSVSFAETESTRKGTSTLEKKKKHRLYCNSYLNFGFTWCSDEEQPVPECLICHTKLSNEALVPSKLSRHFSKKHGNLSDKPASYFKRLLEERKQQSVTFTQTFQVSMKSQYASYLVAEIIAKNSKPHTEAEKAVFPACSAIVKTMFGPEAEEKIRQIPLSNDTIHRRICDMSTDIQDTVISSVKQSKMLTIQVDESTDISGKAQLIAFIWFVSDGKISDQFFCCKELKERTTGQDIFDTLSKYLEENELTWKECVGLCTDGAPSMIGSIKGFVSLVKKVNSEIITTHGFLYRGVLIGKTLNSDLTQVLKEVIEMVNYIKARPLKSRLFTKLCKEMKANYENLLLHTETR